MKAPDYIKQRQILWARRRGIRLIGSAGDRGERAYTPTLVENLFETLADEARREFASGAGGELGEGRVPGKMQAVHSSSALGRNVFHYWRRLGNAAAIARALELPATDGLGLAFERQHPIPGIERIPPHLDVALVYPAGHRLREVGIECKFTEAYGGRKHGGLKAAYLEKGELWHGLTRLRRLAEEISPDDESFEHLHPAQLIKHVLGLTAAAGSTTRFRLVYLWYAAPGAEGSAHEDEVNRFAEIARTDGIAFSALTYQELIVKLAGSERDAHGKYVDYLTERYL